MCGDKKICRGEDKTDARRRRQREGAATRKAEKQLALAKSKEGPAYVCVNCHRVMYRPKVPVLNRTQAQLCSELA